MNYRDSLKGILPALMTAFTEDDSQIDEIRIRALVKKLLDAGVHGLYVGGSSGEMILCTPEERMRLLEVVMDEVRNAGRKVNIIAHVGGASTRESILLAKHAEKTGATAISSVTPFYFAYSFAEVKRFYEDLASATVLPTIVYNIPARTGMTLNEKQLNEILSIPGVAGMKHTSSDFFLLQRLVSEHPEQVFYNGSDEALLSGLAAGANGGIGTTYNFQPRRMLAIYEHFLSGQIAEAQKEQDMANRLISEICQYGVISACKEMITLSGIPYGKPRKPFLPLSEKEHDHLAALIKETPIY